MFTTVFDIRIPFICYILHNNYNHPSEYRRNHKTKMLYLKNSKQVINRIREVAITALGISECDKMSKLGKS